MKKVFIISMALMLSCSWAVAQTSDGDNGIGIGESSASYDVSFTVYAPPPQCSGTRFVTRATIECRLLWENGTIIHTFTRQMDWNSVANVFSTLGGCTGCAPDYIEYCIKGYDDFNYGGEGLLIYHESKKVPAAPASTGGTHITIQSNEWNGKCFGASQMTPKCDL
jgi:hypothetical protein